MVNSFFCKNSIIHLYDRTVYDGEFIKGLKHGFGRIVYPTGNRYEGYWKNDMKDGKGTMFWDTLMERVIFEEK